MNKKQKESPGPDSASRPKFFVNLWPALAVIVLTFLAVWAVDAIFITIQGQVDKSKVREFSLDAYLHLSIPIAVLVMEVYVIWKMVQESQERAHTIAEIRELTSRSGRAEYMLNLANAIRETRSEARFTSATMEVSSSSQGQRTIVEAARARIKSGSYVHKGLLARTQKTLPGAIELAIQAQHIEIRVTEVVALSRLRFFVRDREESILGVAEGQPDLSDPKETTQSTRIRSRMLAGALEKQFDELWNDKAVPVRDYVDELISAASPINKVEVRTWFSAIKCETRELDDALCKNSTLYASLPEDIEAKATPLVPKQEVPNQNQHG